jgi:tRNA threonylcarbamoyl adenosine modification protein YeaZ
MKKILAVEWSSRRISCALTGCDEVWTECPRFHAPTAMGLLDRLFAEHEISWEQIGEIRVGKGPGNYSGVRQAFAWAFGASAPGGIRVRSVSSGQAQANRLQKEGETEFWILGDARRGTWWGAAAGETMEWEIATPEEWIKRVSGNPVFSGESERLTGVEGIRQHTPTAIDLLNVPENSLSDDNRPLYLHPAVSV